MNKLAFAKLSVSPAEALEVIKAFMAPFPSLSGVKPEDVLRVVSSTPREHLEVLDMEQKMEASLHYKQKAALRRIRTGLDESSFGQWPGKVQVFDRTDWCAHWELILTPYVADRILKITGGVVGTGHGESTTRTITIDCLQRPSGNAMSKLIKWIDENPQAVNAVAWDNRESLPEERYWNEFPEWDELLK